MKPECSGPKERALTLLEVLLVLAAIAILALLLLPRIRVQRQNVDPRTRCLMNLKELGLAMRVFSIDHGEKYPWRVAAAKGGAEIPPASLDPTLQYLALGTNLSSPKILACPADERVVRSASVAGLLRSNISYFVSLEGDENQPQSLLSGDRNVTGGVNSNGIYYLTPTSQVGWGADIHHLVGNIGLGDGSAQTTLAAGLRHQLQAATNQTIRLLVP